MPTLISSSAALVSARDADPFALAQMAAAAYLARHSGRTLETYRYDLRTFFQWCRDVGLDVLEAKRAHIELWRSAMEERGLAASTIDRRLTTICVGSTVSPISTAELPRTQRSTPADPRSTRAKAVASTAASSPDSSSRPSATPEHAAQAALLSLNGLRVSEAYATDAEDLGFDQGHRTMRIIGKGHKLAVIPLVPRGRSDHRPRSGRAILRTDPAPPRRPEARPAHSAPLDPLHRQAGRPGRRPSPHAAGSFHHAALDAGVPLRDVQIAAALCRTKDDHAR